MNRCDHHRPLYGRKNEIACLQEIAASVLRKGDFVVDQPLQRNGCFGHTDCDCTISTESTSHSEEDNAVRSCNGLAISQHHSNFVVGDDGEGGSHLVLVSGRPGSGKRALVASALRQCKCCHRKSPFLFVSGRFHSMKNSDTGCKSKGPNKAFIAITRAIQEILQILSNPNNAELSYAIRQTLLSLLKNPEDANELCEIVPAIKHWLRGENDSNPLSVESLNHSMQNPFVTSEMQFVVQQTQFWFPALQRFLHAVVSCVPLVIFLEDLQFVDETSLNLIKSLLENFREKEQTDAATKGLLIVSTCSDGDGVPLSKTLFSFIESNFEVDVNPSSPSDMNDSLQNQSPAFKPTVFHTKQNNFHRIFLSDITWDDVNHWLQECDGTIKRCSRKQREEITNLAISRSNGNPLHLRYLLQFLVQDVKVLQEPIHKKQIPSEIEDLYMNIFLQQDESVQAFLQVTSLLAHHTSNGGDVYLDVLEIAVNLSCMDIVEMAIGFGLIECSLTQPCIYFCRESFEIASYRTIVDEKALSLKVGRRIWRSAILSHEKVEVSEDSVVSRVLLSTKLLKNSIDLLTDIDERIYMSQLCYETGQKSSSLGDFYTSAQLFEFAILVLGSELWQRHDLYEASLLLHKAAAQAYCSIADYDNMDRTLDLIFDHAVVFKDKLPAYLIMVYASGSRHQHLDAYRTTCMVMRELGEPINANPSTITVFIHFLRTKWLLGSKSDSYLRSLPIADDADFLLLMQFLCFASFHTYIINPNFSVLLSLRLARLAARHGISGPSAVGFSAFGFVLNSFRSFAEAHRMGQLSLEFADRFKVWRPRIHNVYYGYIHHWTYPFRDSLEPMLRAQREALVYGDMEMHAASFFIETIISFHAGLSVSILEPRARSYCHDIDEIDQRNAILLLLPLWSLLNDLQGSRSNLVLRPESEIIDARSALNHCIKEGNKFMAGIYYVYRTIWFYFIEDYEQALQKAKKAFELLKIFDFDLTFYEGLAALSMAWSSKSWLRGRRLIAIGKKSAKRMKRWADRCPENFRNKQWLLEAEIAALNGKSVQALLLFERSIVKAKHEAFVHEEGIAYEHLGNYQRHLGSDSEAKTCYENARKAYEKWGASILVDRIDALLHQLKQ